MIKRLISVAFALALSGCVTVDYPQLPPGSFAGKVLVMWVDGGGPSGDGTFLFVPDPKNPLIFRRSDASKPGAVIQPGLMYTDGGSIPKSAQVFKGLSPWGYAPAYMIHDWMFVAHHCIIDGDDDRRFDQVRDITFDDSAAILGEGIRGLVAQRQVQPNDIAGDAVTAAVDSSVARNLWDARGACAASRVRAEDIAAAEQAIPGSTRLAARRSFRVPSGTAIVAPRRPARVITQITF